MKYTEFKKIYESIKETNFIINSEGNLEILIPSELTIEKLMVEKENKSDAEFLWDNYEYELTNGFNVLGFDISEYEIIITDGIVDEETTQEDILNTKAWRHLDNYKISLIDELIEDGVVTLHKINLVDILNINSFIKENKNNKITKAAKEFISKKIKVLKDEGYQQDQAAAIAYSYAKKEGYKIPKKK